MKNVSFQYFLKTNLFILMFLLALSLQSQSVNKSKFRTDKHPRIFVTTEDKTAILQKIEHTQWARKIYNDLKREVDPIVERHQENPSYIISRMQMHWEDGKRYTQFYTDGNWIPRREGNAKYPTVRVTYGRAASNSVGFQSFDKLIPYGNGVLTKKKGTHTFVKNPIPSTDSKYASFNLGEDWEIVPFEETGLGTETVNRAFVHLAWKSSILYYLTGDKRYAKLSADILWNFVRGAAQQEQINPNQKKNAHGFLSFETLGDTRHFSTIPVAYDMIYDYLHNEYFYSKQFEEGIEGELWAPAHPEGRDWAISQFEIMFKKLIENKLTRGGALHGNWNTNEHQSGMLYALALDNDDQYNDGKGREYYVNRFIYGPTTDTHGAYVDVLRANISPITGLWPEAPAGYGQGSTAQLVRFGYIYYKNGIDLLSDDPLLKKASLAMPQMLFPNGYVTNFGDASYLKMHTNQAELLLAYSKEKGDTVMGEQFAEILQFVEERNFDDEFYAPLFFYLSEVPETNRSISLAKTSYSKVYSLIFERNMANDYRDALAFAVSGFNEATGHRQPNGLNMELYGRGHILAPDQGIGADYWSKDTHRYKINIAAHNTVSPNGKPADNNISQILEIQNAEPTIKEGEESTYTISPNHQYVDVLNHFKTEEIKAKQRRMLSIVRTSPQTGYYVDIFRSDVIEPKNEYHDYIYHNMGITSSMFDENGKALNMATVPLDTLSGFGYEFFKTKGSLISNKDWSCKFDLGLDDTYMRMFMLGEESRTIYHLDSPNNHRYYAASLKQLPVPAVLVRQTGAAWNKPFVAIYEPYGNGVTARIKKIFTGKTKAQENIVKFTVEHYEPERVDHIINSTNVNNPTEYMGINFNGIYNVVSYLGKNIQSIYIGNGKSFKIKGLEIEGVHGEVFNAYLEYKNGEYYFTCDKPVTIKTEKGEQINKDKTTYQKIKL